MLERYTQEEFHDALRHLAGAAVSLTRRTTLVHAAAARVMKTKIPDDAERFLRHFDRLSKADQVRIIQRRDAMLIEHWTRTVFGGGAADERHFKASRDADE